ncbi:MAG: hypothetical protein ACW987_15515 [Candidatus Thorarchaeota archaeon]|jgi:hypothetical protein
MASTIHKKQVKPYEAGCVVRRHGKGYLTTDTKKWLEQYPLSYFLYDPPILILDEKKWGICDQGVSYVEHDGIYHAQTVVGRSNYYNASDILMEILNGWASALVPLVGDKVKLLQPGGVSRRFIFHRGGHIDNYALYRKEYQDLGMIQECMLPENDPLRGLHLAGKDMCASLHWQHVENGSQSTKDRYTSRLVGEMTYDAVAPIEDHPPQDQLALIAWLPIDEIDIVDSKDMQDKSPVMDAIAFLAGQSALPVFITDN